jgi:aminopeptidase N
MKTKIIVYLLSFCFLLPTFVFAQKRQTNSNFSNVEKNFKGFSPKLLPSEVQKAYDVKWYFLNLNAEDNTVALSGDVTIKAEVVWDVMDTLCLHLHQDYIIDSILIDGVKKEVITNQHERMVAGLNMPKNTVFDVQVFYHGSYSGSGGFFSGINTATDNRWGGNVHVTWTLSEANNAFHWFPVKQDLTDKADSSWVFITTTKPNMAASNGLLTNVVDLPDNKVRYEWKSTYPIDYYLIFIAVAEYQDYSIYATIPQTGEQLLIQNYIYNTPRCLSENQEAMDETKDMIEYYSEIFGEYPFSREKYGHALVLLSGAMEHQTMTTTGFLYDGIIAHELTHQWFGDNVTCASWQYIWLNEGFASYGELLWDEHKNGKEEAFSSFKTDVINSVISKGKTGSVFVPIEYIDDENRVFSRTLTYDKGAILVHMIRYEWGDDELFFNILQTYQNRFKDNVATAEDFKNVLEELSEIDFIAFFEQWYYGEGYPKFDIKWQQSDNNLTLNSVETTTAPNATPLFKVTYELKITYNDNSSEIVPFYQDEATKQFTYLIPDDKTIKSLSFDPNKWLLATATIKHDTNAIEDIDSDKHVSIYPNPATTTIHVQFDASLQGEKEILLLDSTGKTIQNIKTTNDFCTLDINHLHSGVYFLSVRNDGHVYVRKIVKSNN